MNKISSIGARFRDAHYLRCKQLFESIMSEPGFDATASTGVAFASDLVAYLQANLKKILVGSTSDLLSIIESAEQHFPDFTTYCAPRPRSNARRFNQAMDNLYKLIEKLFDYDAFSAKDTVPGAYALVREYNQRLCPYCQLHHTNYHLPTSRGAFMIRPPLDHFYPRTKYPFLAVSLSNLVPACHQCNSGVKGSRDPLTQRIPHPLDASQQISIVYKCDSALPPNRINSQDDFSINLLAQDRSSQQYLNFFRLAERYQWYGAELMDLYRRYQRFIELESGLKTAIRRDEFLLGFPSNEAKDRALGNVMKIIVEQLP